MYGADIDGVMASAGRLVNDSKKLLTASGAPPSIKHRRADRRPAGLPVERHTRGYEVRSVLWLSTDG